ncbi:hypothetical protein THAOC_19568 [Thalassiosira oceanica]|uniref:Uncharacterized protein n=1 Tax=Thalassiosira oceanica TaxID=159749 RepID=K0SGN7_THAOC|nr:hypothetical protein THAOC_19568 [Thalassiosira oceanica]|eukprot:EJK60136.1 hypothetical protein THAOC_19568 [Thalassiosira oceanica]
MSLVAVASAVGRAVMTRLPARPSASVAFYVRRALRTVASLPAEASAEARAGARGCYAALRCQNELEAPALGAFETEPFTMRMEPTRPPPRRDAASVDDASLAEATGRHVRIAQFWSPWWYDKSFLTAESRQMARPDGLKRRRRRRHPQLPSTDDAEIDSQRGREQQRSSVALFVYLPKIKPATRRRRSLDR